MVYVRSSSTSPARRSYHLGYDKMEYKRLNWLSVRRAAEAKADQWEIVEFPAIMPSGKPLWPEYWKLEELEAVKASTGVQKWNAQYMQNPTSEEGAIIKREWWVPWEEEWIPALKHVIQSYDTAFGKKQTSDYSAITTWGVFYLNDDSPASLILLDAKKGRYDFPELKQVAFEQWKYWDPDTVIVEAKASGQPLTDELRKMGIPVVNFTPSKGNDKHTRVNSVAPLFESGMIYAPNQEFAEEVIEECAAFPFGDHDDLVDSTTQAIMRFDRVDLYYILMMKKKNRCIKRKGTTINYGKSNIRNTSKALRQWIFTKNHGHKNKCSQTKRV